MPGEGRSENLGKMGTNRDIYCYANRGWSISKEKISTIGTKTLVMPPFFCMSIFLSLGTKSL